MREGDIPGQYFLHVWGVGSGSFFKLISLWVVRNFCAYEIHAILACGNFWLQIEYFYQLSWDDVGTTLREYDCSRCYN